MDPEQWQKAKHIFAAALECEPGARRALLLDACGADESLRNELESLLSAYESSGGLSQPAWLENPPAETTIAGKTIGVYRLIRKLGEGGMGQVWLAGQTEPVQREVALKLIRVGIYDDAVLKRFQAERQSLAMMDHPAIAKVFDAGATSDGQPYFVMEYVQGAPITDYCNEKKLSVRDRLELLRAACDGVQHAHQKAIIHRDLKPANILVVENGGKPTLRIIDFGLAKAAVPPSDDRKTLTRVGSFIGTPGYMSPEQADLATHDVDTRADVYSLGAILYELLTDSLPFEPKPSRPLDEMLRQLREEDPAPPSTRVPALRGDLDAIAMKALERDRARRYGSPAELAEDIERHLQNRPVVARPASWSYQLQKYVRRHRLGVAAAVVIAVLLAASAVIQAVELRRTTRERDRANRIADFMTTMFKIADPGEARGNSVTAREILDRASKDIETGLAQDRPLQAQMMDLMGNVYAGLGLFSRAQPLLERAVEIRTRIDGAENAETLASRHSLADTLGRRGRYPDSEKLERETVEISRRVLGPGNASTLRSMASLAITLENEGRLPDAEQLNRDTMELGRRALGEDHPDTLRPMNSLGNVLQREGRFVDAQQIHTDVLERRRRVLGAEHPQTLITMQGLANDLRGQTKYAEAAALDREIFDIRRRIFGLEHEHTLASMIDLARDLARQSKYGEAEQLNRQSLDISRRILGPEHFNSISLMINLALNLHQQQRYAEAEALDREAAALSQRVLGAEHLYTLISMGSLANDLARERKFREAEPLARSVIDTETRVAGADHPATIDEMDVLLYCLAAQRRYPDAEDLVRRILEIKQRTFGTDDARTASSRYDLASFLAMEGKRDEAIAALGDAVQHGLASDRLATIQNDLDFRSLRGEPGFKAVVTLVKQRAASNGK